VFLDGDCLPTPDWFAGIIASQRRGPYICCGAVESAPGEFWEACYNVVCFREFLTGRPPESRRFLASYCLWGPRDAFAGVGGFDESLRFAEDLDLTVRLARAGWRLRFEPTVVVVHRKAGQTVGRLIHRGWMHGGTSLRARLLYPDAFGVAPRLMSPPFLVIGAPLISLYFLAKTFRDSPEHRSLIVRAAPAMYLHRVAWCLGAARTRLTGASANDRPSEAGRYSDRDQVNGNPAIPRSKGDDRSALDSASCDSGPHSG
jgi:cellulose synthase/poly-beta-1,6-N-acetylglucosamine synthase-like glycosyltransferase